MKKMIDDKVYRSFLSAFQMFSEPARLVESPLCDSCLVMDRVRKRPDLLPHQALKQVFSETLDVLEDEQEESADLLRGRFWEGLQIEEMIGIDRPRPMGKRSFSNHQQSAIHAFAFLFQQTEAQCLEAKANININVIDNVNLNEMKRGEKRFRFAWSVPVALLLLGAGAWLMWGQQPLPLLETTGLGMIETDVESLAMVTYSEETSIPDIPEESKVEVYGGQNLVKNGSFSDGSHPWWFNYLEERLANGQICNKVTSSGEPWDMMLGQSDLPIESGKTYQIMFDAKATDPAQVYVKVGGATPPYAEFTYTPVDVTQTMKRYEVIFTAESSDRSQLEFHLGGNTADICIDDVTLKVKV